MDSLMTYFWIPIPRTMYSICEIFPLLCVVGQSYRDFLRTMFRWDSKYDILGAMSQNSLWILIELLNEYGGTVGDGIGLESQHTSWLYQCYITSGAIQVAHLQSTTQRFVGSGNRKFPYNTSRKCTPTSYPAAFSFGSAFSASIGSPISFR